MIYQFTGLSGSGKSTIASMIHEALSIPVIDGDEFRKTHSFGFDRMGRITHIRMMQAKALTFDEDVIISAINPYDQVRNEVKSKIIYFKCDLKTLENRDTKGLYKLGILPDGLQYEEPKDCLVVNTGIETIYESFKKVLDFMT